MGMTRTDFGQVIFDPVFDMRTDVEFWLYKRVVSGDDSLSNVDIKQRRIRPLQVGKQKNEKNRPDTMKDGHSCKID
jgi:hypothetical protein